MKIQEVFDHLSYGEFAQLSIGGEDQGEVNDRNYARVVAHIQLGLTALYRRFNLKQRRLNFQLSPGSDTYVLQADDLLKVERVLVDSGEELTLNDRGDEYGCFTPTPSTLRLAPKLAAQGTDTPDLYRTEGLQVVYRANHPKIMGASGVLIAETKSIELPPSHLEALLYFIAARVHGNVGQSGEQTAGNLWFNKYEAECQRLENTGFRVQEVEEDTRFRDRGFV